MPTKRLLVIFFAILSSAARPDYQRGALHITTGPEVQWQSIFTVDTQDEADATAVFPRPTEYNVDRHIESAALNRINQQAKTILSFGCSYDRLFEITRIAPNARLAFEHELTRQADILCLSGKIEANTIKKNLWGVLTLLILDNAVIDFNPDQKPHLMLTAFQWQIYGQNKFIARLVAPENCYSSSIPSISLTAYFVVGSGTVSTGFFVPKDFAAKCRVKR